jgi:uncharacterized protein
MPNLNKLSDLVLSTYKQSDQDFGQWMIENHVPIVAKQAQILSDRFGADANIAVAGAWLHDFGDAFVHRFDEKHEQISQKEARQALVHASYSPSQIEQVLTEVIAPHSCRDGNLPFTLEGKVMATADALAHLTTDFYLQFTWMHLPENMNYQQFLKWVSEKLERDFHRKIFFDEVRAEVIHRYESLKEVFVQ